MLSNIHPSFTGFGSSAMNNDFKIVKGRPYGGIGILIRNDLFSHCSITEYGDDRILGVAYNKDNENILLFIGIFTISIRY